MLKSLVTRAFRQFPRWTGLLSGMAVAINFGALMLGQEFPKALPVAPGAEVFSLTPTPGFFTEPSIAINPLNAQQVVAVFQDNVHASYSQDAGHSWLAAEGVAPANYKVSGDVSAAYDNQGHAFVCYMAFDKLGTFNYWAHGASRSGLFVRRSLDGGKTWDAKHVPVIEHATEPGIPFEDKPYIVADITKSRYAGNLYVGWTRWTLTDSKILLSRSTDDGQSWSKPVEVDRHPGLPRDDNGAAEGFAGVVGPDGTLYAVWSQDDDIFLTTSRDGGQTFSRARTIIHTAPIMFAIQTLERANGFPQVAIDPRSRRLYVTWTDYRNGDLDVFVSTSTDRGKKWRAPVRVNNDPVHDGADQFFQWLAVDPVDGALNVVFYDRRGDPLNRAQIVVLARSTDDGHSFQNYAWTTEPFEAGGVFFGDYSGIAAFGGRVYGVWTEKPPVAPETSTKSEKLQPKPVGTVVKVGIADFKMGTSGASQ
ncbi:MAG TPA: exo-alpha-sialidase [Candidatus Sulfotelmatobacter sp.]